MPLSVPKSAPNPPGEPVADPGSRAGEDHAAKLNAAKRLVLARRRALASGLLLAAALVFIGLQVLPPVFWVRLASAAAEAALVGGLADWFAVTAIFRHPLGLPIPHTALIAKRKAAIGAGLGAFVRNNFWRPEPLLARLRQVNRARQIAGFLVSRKAQRFIAERMQSLIPVLLAQVEDPRVRASAGEALLAVAGRLDPGPMIEAAIEGLIGSGRLGAVVDSGAAMLAGALDALEPGLTRQIGARTGRFVPGAVDRVLAEQVLAAGRGWLEAVRLDGTAERDEALAWLEGRLNLLRANRENRAWLNDLRAAIMDHPAMRELAASAFAELAREIETDLAGPAPVLPQRLGRAARRAGAAIASSPDLQLRINRALETLIREYVVPLREDVSAYIAEEVARWDTGKVVSLIEMEAGSDLQYVRINGTLAGALIGVVLFLLAQAAAMLRG